VTRPKLRKVNSAKRKKKQKAAQEELQKKTGMFLGLPDKCCVCEAPFDKKSREMARTWNVVVYEEEKVIRLTCPPCWKKIELVAEETHAS